MKRALRVLAAGGLLLAACGGGDDQAGTLTVSEIASATKDATTYRFSTEARTDTGPGMPYTGEVDGRAASIAMTQPGGSARQDMIWVDDHLYSRVDARDPKLSYDWCEQQNPSFTEGYAGVRDLDTLANLEGEGRSLRRVGTGRVRDTETVHYEIEGEDSPVDLWVDDQDRLRRLIWTHEGKNQVDTVELYDFGAPIEIAVPQGTSPCRIPGAAAAEAP